MNCTSFERQIADWLSGRLSPERSRRMAAHQNQCARCARRVQAESALRQRWREASAQPVPDIWPQLALRLAAQREKDRTPRRQARKPGLRSPSLLALAAGILLIGMTAYSLRFTDLARLRHSGRLQSVEATSTVGAEPNAPHTAATALSALADVSRGDPAVDDPAGSSMENVWTSLKTDIK